MACPYKPVLSDSSSLSQQAPPQSRGKWEDTAAVQNILTEDGRAESSGQTTTAAVDWDFKDSLWTAHPGTTHLHLQAPGESLCASPNQNPWEFGGSSLTHKPAVLHGSYRFSLTLAQLSHHSPTRASSVTHQSWWPWAGISLISKVSVLHWGSDLTKVSSHSEFLSPVITQSPW